MRPRMVESQAWKKEEPYVSCPDCDPEHGTICGAHYIDHVERLEPAPPAAKSDEPEESVAERLREAPQMWNDGKCVFCAVRFGHGTHDDGCILGDALAALAPTKHEQDHEAMEVLRSASLKKGWKWQWDGMDLQQVTLGPGAPNTHNDPADAVIHARKEGEGK